MLFLIAVVVGFFVFLLLYGRYMNVCGSISKRRMRVSNLRDQVDFRVNKLKKGTKQINKELEEAVLRLDELKETLGEMRTGDYDS